MDIQVVSKFVAQSVIEIGSDTIEILEESMQGPAAIPPATFTDHVARRDNPHEVTLGQVVVPEGENGKWLKVAGQHLITTPPPLTELPPLPEYPDEFVKAHPADPVHGMLIDKVMGSVMVDTVNHKMRLRGDNYTPPPRFYYGTDVLGNIGWHPLPSTLFPVSAMRPEEEQAAEERPSEIRRMTLDAFIDVITSPFYPLIFEDLFTSLLPHWTVQGIASAVASGGFLTTEGVSNTWDFSTTGCFASITVPSNAPFILETALQWTERSNDLCQISINLIGPDGNVMFGVTDGNASTSNFPYVFCDIAGSSNGFTDSAHSGTATIKIQRNSSNVVTVYRNGTALHSAIFKGAFQTLRLGHNNYQTYAGKTARWSPITITLGG